MDRVSNEWRQRSIPEWAVKWSRSGQNRFSNLVRFLVASNIWALRQTGADYGDEEGRIWKRVGVITRKSGSFGHWHSQERQTWPVASAYGSTQYCRPDWHLRSAMVMRRLSVGWNSIVSIPANLICGLLAFGFEAPEG